MGPALCFDTDWLATKPQNVRDAIMKVWQATHDHKRLGMYDVGAIVTAISTDGGDCVQGCGCGLDEVRTSHRLATHIDDLMRLDLEP